MIGKRNHLWKTPPKHFGCRNNDRGSAYNSPKVGFSGEEKGLLDFPFITKKNKPRVTWADPQRETTNNNGINFFKVFDHLQHLSCSRQFENKSWLSQTVPCLNYFKLTEVNWNFYFKIWSFLISALQKCFITSYIVIRKRTEFTIFQQTFPHINYKKDKRQKVIANKDAKPYG